MMFNISLGRSATLLLFCYYESRIRLVDCSAAKIYKIVRKVAMLVFWMPFRSGDETDRFAGHQ